MFKLHEHFLLTLFDFSIVLFVLLNFGGWSSAFNASLFGQDVVLDNLGLWGYQVIDGENRFYYFGFESLLKMFNTMNGMLNDDMLAFFNLGNFYTYLNQLLNYALLNLPQTVQDLLAIGSSPDWKVAIEFITNILYLLVSPILTAVFAFLCVLCLLAYCFVVIAALIMAIGGAFNVYGVNPLTLSTWLSETSQAVATVPLL